MQGLFIIMISYRCPCYQITHIVYMYMYMYITYMAIRDGIPHPEKHAILNITAGLSQFNVIIYYFTLLGKVNCNFELPHAHDFYSDKITHLAPRKSYLVIICPHLHNNVTKIVIRLSLKRCEHCIRP